jgi:xanthine dehydrogenase YagS FAD-binding subunit
MEKALERGEMVKEVEVPRISGPMKQAFLKFTLRRPIDFAIVSVASVITVKERVCLDAHLALGAVAPGPVRANKAEQVLKGRCIDDDTAAEAAVQAVLSTQPLSRNAYKIEITKALVKRALMH